jgi:septum formation protein
MISPRGGSPIVSNRLPLILASESPRRLALLAQAGITPLAVRPTALDETPRPREAPRDYARRLALAKAAAAADAWPDGPAVFLAADTVVACGRRILPKAESAAEVQACLALLSGRRHMVMTAVALSLPDGRARLRLVETRVSFRRLTEGEIAHYAGTGEGLGKAGGYAIQGRAEAFVRGINGSWSNVVGLPLCETVGLLGGCGVAIS